MTSVLRIALVGAATLLAGVALAQSAPVVLMVSFDVPAGTRLIANARRADGGTLWTKTAVVRANEQSVVDWIPLGRLSLRVRQTYPDGGHCSAVRTVTAREKSPFMSLSVEQGKQGRCQVVGEELADVFDELSPAPIGDFPPYAAPWTNESPKAR